jgi:subtilisin family serine protease
MSGNDEQRTAARERFVPEVRRAMAAANFDIAAWPPDWETAGEIDYLYRPGILLTPESDAGRVAESLRDAPAVERHARRRGWEPAADTPVSGIARVRFPVAQAHHTVAALEHVEQQLGSDVATHEHVFEVTPWVHCPATEPEVALTPQDAADPQSVTDALWPPRSTGTAGEGVHISVVDTGLLKGVAGWAPWLADVSADSAADIENPDTWNVAKNKPGSDGYADPYAAHGSFIAGVIRCVAPASTVVVERILGPSGFVSETDMIRQIWQGLSRSPDIINLSAGGYTRNDAAPLALRHLWRDRLSQQGGVVLVAAAGNNGSSRPFWPAAFDWCVGVGSMSRDGQHRSWFSNYGSWVDVYAPGENLVNAYARLPYRTIVKGAKRDTSAGLAKWSGTSFATPVVAALIAARMSRTGENGRVAAEALLAAARGQFRPGVGPRLFP